MARKLDKVDRLLAAGRKRTLLDSAIHSLKESRAWIYKTKRAIGGPPSYAKNRMGCVLTEIDAALRGVRRERANVSRAIANIARGA